MVHAGDAKTGSLAPWWLVGSPPHVMGLFGSPSDAPSHVDASQDVAAIISTIMPSILFH